MLMNIYRYTLFGDTVNVASRMESMSVPGRVQCSRRTADLVREQDPGVPLSERGLVEVKGKGRLRTFWVGDRREPGPSAEGESDKCHRQLGPGRGGSRSPTWARSFMAGAPADVLDFVV